MYQLPKCLLSMYTGVLFEGAFSLWVFLICFPWEIKGFYQISWGNEVDFTDMMYIFSNAATRGVLQKKVFSEILRNFIEHLFYRTRLGDCFFFFKNLSLKLKFQKNEKRYFVDERAMITMTLISSCQWKTLVPFCLRRKPWKNICDTNSELLQDLTKNNLCHSKQQ